MTDTEGLEQDDGSGRTCSGGQDKDDRIMWTVAQDGIWRRKLEGPENKSKF